MSALSFSPLNIQKNSSRYTEQIRYTEQSRAAFKINRKAAKAVQAEKKRCRRVQKSSSRCSRTIQ